MQPAAHFDLIPGPLGLEPLFHVTILSNFVRAYDKYARSYDKAKIPESTFPNQFFLLSRTELAVGIAKAGALLQKAAVPGDRLLVLETHAAPQALRPNLRTGLGRFVEQSHVRVAGLHFLNDSAALSPVQIEEAYALSLKLHLTGPARYAELTPRSVSILPVAKACQAKCPFCFSKASVSDDIETKPIDWTRIAETLHQGRLHGAARAVITGGGEPTLLKASDLRRVIRECAAVFPKVVLITNGYKLGCLPEPERAAELQELDAAGLSVLAISRHHFDAARNAELMHLTTRSESVAATVAALRPSLRQLKLRWICVLQRGGIENRESLERYLDWAVDCGVTEVCFKELYISSSIESEYHDRAANEWSALHQAPLQLLVDYARDAGWRIVDQLPWGAPVFAGERNGLPIRIAAYTEPSVFWELAHGLCRSWNLMADGRCLASLEDRNSEVEASGLRRLPSVS